MPPSQQVRLVTERGVAGIELASPRRKNRLDSGLAAAFRAAVEAAGADESVRAVLVSARGTDFCAGGTPLQATRGRLAEFRVADALAAAAQPVVIALRGRVFDQGLELALAADIRVASGDARFAMRQVVAGGMPFDGGTQRLPRTVGRGLAADMLLTGRELNAREASLAGLVTVLAAPGRLDSIARAIAHEIARRGSAAGRHAKEAIARGTEMPLEDGMRLEADLGLLLLGDRERAEGLAAFRDRRAPRFVR